MIHFTFGRLVNLEFDIFLGEFRIVSWGPESVPPGPAVRICFNTQVLSILVDTGYGGE